ncbi:MAG: hypothetical protein IAC77_01145 [Proteobacteria bacterium]|uniref:Flagellar motor protein MotA n=1 Tax=Candidatus Enterousia excrementavium TaxID=2840789 RepID=A0A940DEK4_9PROT|nr:hypothetical protein [Candidatus Enterousia excrementavium]
MTNQFHRALNRMAFFTALLVAGLILFYDAFLRVASANILLNGIIIGTTIFGIGLCFVEMFKLLPEYKWARAYFSGKKNAPLPPRLLRPVALILRARPVRISATTLNGMLDMILTRFEDSRESVRYITNTLVFLGLLGTFWGLILTVGGFADLIGTLNFANESVLQDMQAGLTVPLSGMATAFTSSLMGLAGSLAIGFLGLQVQLAQNAIFREVEDYLSAHTSVATTDTVSTVLPQINENLSAIRQTFTE